MAAIAEDQTMEEEEEEQGVGPIPLARLEVWIERMQLTTREMESRPVISRNS
jgi:hypothetical protein